MPLSSRFRPLCLLASLCWMLMPPAQAQFLPFVASDEQKALNFAERAFKDSLYDVAQSKLTEFQAAYPKSPSIPQVRWLLGQTLYFNGQYQKALDIFQAPPSDTPEDLLPGYLFWEAETLSSMDKWKNAQDKYEDLIKRYPNYDHLILARIGLANALYGLDRKQEALDQLTDLRLAGLKDQDAQKAALLQTKMLIAEQRLKEAREILDQLNKQKLSPPLNFESFHWTGELALRQDDPDAAAQAFDKIVNDPRATPRELVAMSWFGMGEVQTRRKNWKEAAAAYEKCFRLSRDPRIIEPAIVNYLEAQRANNALTAGALAIRDFVGATKGSTVVGLYAIGKFYYNEKNYDAAILELDSLAKNYPDSPWTGSSRLLIAESLLQKNNRDEALALLQKIRDENPKTSLGRSAQLRLGDLQYQAGDFAKAAATFLEVAQSNDPAVSEEASYRALLALARTGKLEDFTKAEARMREKFPNSPLLRNLVFEKARLLEEAGKGAEARALYEAILKDPKAAQDFPMATRNTAISFYREGQYAQAIEWFKTFETKFKDHPFALDSAYWRILSESLANTKTPEMIRQDLQALLVRAGKDPLAVNISFQIAQSIYNQQNYGEAQKRFQELAGKLPNSPLADQALYLAGKSAMGLNNQEEAIRIFEKIKNDSSYKLEARLGQIRSYMAQGKYEAALGIADSVLSTLPESPGRVELMLRRAGCLYTLAGSKNNPEFYTKAYEAVQNVLSSKNASVVQKNEAGCLKGEILQRQNKNSEALEAYLDVVYGRLFNQALNPPQPEFFWFVRAGQEAAQIKIDQQDIKGAVAIYRILERLGGPNRKQFRETIEDLKSRHFLWEES